jgi:DNA-binding PadR family transcriptional regulator
MPEISVSLSAAAILQAVDHGYVYGFDIMDATGLPSGTVYPALRRMEAAGLIASRWESAASAQKDQRPPRRYYELTSAGRTAQQAAARRYHLADRPAGRAATKPSVASR